MMNCTSTKLLVVVIIAMALVAGLANIDRPREVWDERSRFFSGLAYWSNIINLKFDAESWDINSGHPPMAKYMHGLVNGVFIAFTNPSLLKMDTNDAVILLDQVRTTLPSRFLSLGLAIIIYLTTFLIGKELFNKRVGFLATIMLILFPAFTAQVRITNLDIPMVFFLTLSILFLIRGMKSKSANSKYYLLFGVAAALATSSIFSGGLAFILGFVMFVIFMSLKTHDMPESLRRLSSIYKGRDAFKSRLTKIPPFLLASPLLGMAIFYALWPWLWGDPIGKLASSLGGWGLYHNANGIDVFIGSTAAPGFGYFITYFLFKTPVLVFALAAISLFWLKKRGLKKEYLIVLAWLLVTLLAISSFVPTKIAGDMYILPLYPALAILAALGLEKIFERFGKKIFIPIAGLTIIYLAVSCALVHPFYLDYYNEFSGGPANVYNNKLFRIGMLGEGLDYGVDYINANAPLNSSIEFHAAPMHVLRGFRDDIVQENSFYPKDMVARASNFTPDYSFHGADFIIENVYYKWLINQSFYPESMGYKMVYEVQVEGAPLAWVYEKQ